MSPSGPMMHSQAVSQESPIKALQCSHCALVFKSKVYLFEHLNKVHGFTVDNALIQSGLKQPGIKKGNSDSNSSTAGNVFQCQHCNFKAAHWDALNEHHKLCQGKTENWNNIGNLYIPANPETKITMTSTNQHTEDAEAKQTSPFYSVASISNAECTLDSSKNLKTYTRPLQVTNFSIAPSGSDWKSPGTSGDSQMLLDSTKGTLILQESPSSSNPKSSGVLKVTATSMIDMSRHYSHKSLLDDHLLISDVKSCNTKEEFKDIIPKKTGKRTNYESSAGPPSKNAKSCENETKPSDTGKQQSLEFSEDDEEDIPVNGDTESANVYFCKHCDYSNTCVKSLSSHYQSDHPCVRCNTVYILDPCDKSATFRCLECPVEFLSVADLKSHYMEDHSEAPDVLKMQSHELCLVFKCFVCGFTTDILKTLKQHHKEMHPTHNMDNSLLYCRYSQLTCEKAPVPERSEGNTPNSIQTPRKEVKSAPTLQHPTSRGADGSVYHCNNCDFSHKSVIVMHVHYQKSHPDQSVTIDKIKRLHAASQKMPKKPPNAVTIVEKCQLQKSTSESPKKMKDKADMSQQIVVMSLMDLKHTPGPSNSNMESVNCKKLESAESQSKANKSLMVQDQEMSAGMDSSPDQMFYCQFCSYSNPKARSILGHHYAKHAHKGPISVEEIICYSTELLEQKGPSQATTSGNTPSSDSKQVDVYSKEEHAVEPSVMASDPYECPEILFYCQKCNYANPSVKGVLNHQRKTHNIHKAISLSRDCIINHTALIRKEIEQSKSHTKDLSVALPLPLMNEGDENRFFCHFCNYRNSALETVVRHYLKWHHGFEDRSKQIHLYTSLVLERKNKLHLRTAENKDASRPNTENKKCEQTKKKELGKCVSPSFSVTTLETQRILQCYRCTYVTHNVCNLKRHMWKIHRSNRSSNALLRVCFRQGNIQSGYHCELCVFSHRNAAKLYKHYLEQHPDRKASLEYISTQLYVGPDAISTKMKHTTGVSDGDGTDGNFTPKRSGEKETKTYSCKACSFKGPSMSSITHHYHAVHPWSVKEDGSVLGGIVSKKKKANSTLEDQHKIPEIFDSYQIPLEFDQPPGSPHEVSPTEFKCAFCSVTFQTEHSLKIHCGMKHQEAIGEHEEQQIQTRVHVFKCPHCTYINNMYQGLLTHSQMMHPSLEFREKNLYIDVKYLQSLESSSKPGEGARYRGYMCKVCMQVYSTRRKLGKHHEKEHKGAVRNTRSNIIKPPSIRTQQSNTYSAQGSVSKASFLSKKIYAVVKCQECNYSCSTKIALNRHMLVHHRKQGVSKDGANNCVLCSIYYFSKKKLGIHYVKKHGMNAYLKYFVPVYKQLKSVPASFNPPSTQQPGSTSQACTSSGTTDNNMLVYMCQACPYVNTSYHGTLTHCQMKHPNLVVRADELKTKEIHLSNMVNCKVGKGSNERGYVCNQCPQIHASVAKLKIHRERAHDRAEPSASEHSAEITTEEQPDHSSVGSVFKDANLKYKTSAGSATKVDFLQSDAQTKKSKEYMYRCHMCSYTGSCRKYLYTHYKFTHKLDAFSRHMFLEKYNKRKFRISTKARSEDSGSIKCKKCPGLTFGSPQLLIAHYSTIHRSDCKMDFTVIALRSARSTGIYKCGQCKDRINGIKNLSRHLDRHRARRMKKMSAAETEVVPVVTKAVESKPIKVSCLPVNTEFNSLLGSYS